MFPLCQVQQNMNWANFSAEYFPNKFFCVTLRCSLSKAPLEEDYNCTVEHTKVKKCPTSFWGYIMTQFHMIHSSFYRNTVYRVQDNLHLQEEPEDKYLYFFSSN